MVDHQLPNLSQLESAAERVYQILQPTAQINWPLLSKRCGCELWLKHENHNPTGAFKVRGGLIYTENLLIRSPEIKGLCAATRGNHGQSIAFAAGHHGLNSVIVVPEGNNPEKNAAMQALGAELVVHGRDFDEAVPHARQLAEQRGLHLIPSFHMDLVLGVASCGLELLKSNPDLDRVYVPVGLGSGICAMAAARNALGLDTEIIGVVSERADTYLQSFSARECRPTKSADTLADGLAVRVPNETALSILLENVSRIVAVSDEEVLQAVKHLFSDTHNVSEGAGAAPLAAVLSEAETNAGKKIAAVISGGNIDRTLFLAALGAV